MDVSSELTDLELIIAIADSGSTTCLSRNPQVVGEHLIATYPERTWQSATTRRPSTSSP
jgi:hypothetical protein